MKTVASEKGQMTVPKRLRDRLRIRPGQTLEVCEDNERQVATKLNEQDPRRQRLWLLELPVSTDELLAVLRGKAEVP
jgi:AbrB family looped-hinge helix DNA binding protein